VRLLIALATFAAGACCSSLPRVPERRLPFPVSIRSEGNVEVRRFQWRDRKRSRDVPATVYVPAERSGPLPVVVFSHGIGEDRDSYAWLGEALARNGFVSVHVTHAGTDRAVLERGYRHLYRAVKQKENWVNRPLDVSFAIDSLREIPEADAHRIAVAGHSAGAFTAFAVAGLRMQEGTLRDERVRAAIPMSMPRLDGVVPEGGYDGVAVPTLNLTGTCDTSLIYRTFPRHRRIPFESAKSSQQSLVTLQGANHDSFVVRDRHEPAIVAVTIAFLRAWLLDDRDARAWFATEGKDDVRGTALSVERKRAPAS
jgi:predicted dienelactone hydrolase